MLAFLIGLGAGTAIGATASPELRALFHKLYNTAKIWLSKPPVE